MTSQNPCNVFMNDGRGPSLAQTDYRISPMYNFNHFPTSHEYRRFLQTNASKIMHTTNQSMEPSQCAVPNRPFQPQVQWKAPVLPYHQIHSQQVYR